VIDNDIFQIVTLVLLLLALVVSLVSLSTLGKLRRELESRGSDTAASPSGGYEGAAAGAAWGGGAPAAEPVAAHPLETASAAPVAATSAAAQPAAAQPGAAGDPQDQPFERDGRWWFKRGDELLVYDEGTGQWQPAPGGAGVAAAAGTGTAQMPAVGGAVATQEVGAHWKCPTCGAVNGSTAASCRMCFTARP
jgi:predicted RNA-binding Zn-ribbon protein involved in translation (DUF1610 family)